MVADNLLSIRLAGAGYDVASIVPATGGTVAHAGVVTLADSSRVFAKTLQEDVAGVFEIEAEGLRSLGDRSATTPDVLAVTPRLLVLSLLRPRPDDSPDFWARLGTMLATLHTTNRHEKFGWHHDGWLGRMPQINTWTESGHTFYSEQRILRYLPEPIAQEALTAEDRRAVERICAQLPSIVPEQPATLTHGDLWSGNVMADDSGTPALIDPAVSYNWPEVDISMMWCAGRTPASESFFTAYQNIAPLHDGWQDRAPILMVRELLSTIAHGDDSWGALAKLREIIAPFRPRHS